MSLRPLFIITTSCIDGVGITPYTGYSLDPVHAGQCLRDGAAVNTVQVSSAAIDLACEQGHLLHTVFILRDEEQVAGQYSFSMLELADTLTRVAKYSDRVAVITEELYGNSCNSLARSTVRTRHPYPGGLLEAFNDAAGIEAR